ncbi:flagellar biosynthetic protein FlhB [Desulfobaculum xiamenense]|uniref:Flagellar biosynthetic protein FlhB n=1 Tax=Desulfobaculum xiamenense TaxID=995050 RepID=A0A846QE84_9BACT|nr:flagellar biosynthesis protein FlhB [Desulfobaculum xiamenense]NJB67046.1 flagellar biosynthetic protein FlhB [Desulfobaculum xiamenense]
MARDPSKTEKATPKRRNKAREEGNVAKSQELGKATILMGGLVALYIFMDLIAKEMKHIFAWFCGEGLLFEVNPQSVYALFTSLSESLALMILPIMAVLLVVAFLTMRLQVGQLWTTKVFEPKFEKIFNVFSGIKRLLLDPKVFIRLGKSVLQALFIGIAPYIVLKSEIPKLAPLFFSNAEGIAAYILTIGLKMSIYALIPMLIIGIADTVYTFWDYNENIKMTKQEIKDEHKQAEGDPIVKGKQREKMMKTMAGRMLQKVPQADVVVTNPTHIAVALKYDAMEAPAPMVLAKGVDHLAEKIKQIARENNIPIRENKPLARALYKSVEIGDVIPEELYQAVASILAQIYKLRRR